MANGRARCSQCNQVFNALENFAETKDETVDWPESRFISQIDFEHDNAAIAQNPESLTTEHATKEAPDLLSELANRYKSEALESETIVNNQPEDNAAESTDTDAQQSTIDTRFSDYLAELERQTLESTQNDTAEDTPEEENPDKAAFFDSLEIDEEAELDLPLIEAAQPEEEGDTQDDTLGELEDEDQPPNVTIDDLDIDSSDDEPEEEDGYEWPFVDNEQRSASDDKNDNNADEEVDDEPQAATYDIDDEETTPNFNADIDLDEDSDDKVDPILKGNIDINDPLPYRLAENVPDIKPTEDALSVDDVLDGKAKRRGRALLLILLILVMATVAAIQFTWINREQLIEHPLGAKYLNKLCGVIDCKLPERRAPEQFQVINRSLIIAPDQPHILQLKLSFTNTANFPQPYPGLLLNLYSSDEKLIARRVFRPDEYMGRTISERSLIKPRETISINMSLEEPSEEITGFRFDFQ